MPQSKFARWLASGSGKIVGIKEGSCKEQLHDIPIRILQEDGTFRDKTEEELLAETPESLLDALYRGQALDCDRFMLKQIDGG